MVGSLEGRSVAGEALLLLRPLCRHCPAFAREACPAASPYCGSGIVVSGASRGQPVRCRFLCHPAGPGVCQPGTEGPGRVTSPLPVAQRNSAGALPRAAPGPDLAKQNLSSGCAPVLSQGLQIRAAEKRVCTRVPHTQDTRALPSTASPQRGPCTSQPRWARAMRRMAAASVLAVRLACTTSNNSRTELEVVASRFRE